MTQTLEQIIARWDSGEGKPFKRKLIDWKKYGGDGALPPDDIGCMCAQGQVLHLLGGWSPQRLRHAAQSAADAETAKLLGISRAHAVLLRNVNDRVDGAPSVVLTHPERVIGDQAPTILAFWHHLDAMSAEDWRKVVAAMTAARDAARDAARVAAGEEAGAAARAAALDAALDAARALARVVAGDAAQVAARVAARAIARVAAGATNEIQGASVMRERGQPFVLLPMFGFATPEDVLKITKPRAR
jgi:hypothetical protein